MKVTFITNWQDSCGIAIYGENLLNHLSENIEINLVPPSNWEFACSQLVGSDLVHINFHEGLRFGFDLEKFVEEAKKFGFPVILTNHTTLYKAPWFQKLDKIVTHIPNLEFGDKNIVIPQPIWKLELEEAPRHDYIGITQAGFPFAWKWYDKICESAVKLSKSHTMLVYLFMPDTYHGHAQMEINRCKSILRGKINYDFYTEWFDDKEIIHRMHQNANVACYYTGEKREGPSASVRMAIAAQLPTIVNGNAYQYQDILNEEGVYPCYQDEDLPDIIQKAYSENKRPLQLIEKQSYEVVAKKYEELWINTATKRN